MSMPDHLISQLYKQPENAEKAADEKPIFCTNLDLLKRISNNKYIQSTGEVFLRPQSALKYHLLPLLQNQLIGRAFHDNIPKDEQKVLYGLILLLDTVDPAWRELPEQWQSLGATLSPFTPDKAKEILDAILQEVKIKNPGPMLYERRKTENDQSRVIRHFKLSKDMWNDFISVERDRAIKKIMAE